MFLTRKGVALALGNPHFASRHDGLRARGKVDAVSERYGIASKAGVFWFFSSEKNILSSLLFCLLLQACAAPPPSAYVAKSAAAQAATVPLGANEAGEACTQDGAPGDPEASIYCGTWQQPSAHVALSTEAGVQSLSALVTSSPWRVQLDRRLECTNQSNAMILGRYPAVVLGCTTRLGGWPQVALAAQVGDRFWLADGVRPALPAMERSIGVLSGAVAPGAIAAQPVSAGLTAQRLAAKAFKSGDIGQYQSLIRVANRANMEGNYPAAEAAYRAAATLQERVQGRESPGLARTLAGEALQLSDQGRYAEADAMFRRAEKLAASPRQNDPVMPALVVHYRGLHLLNQGKIAEGIDALHRAEAAYKAQLPPGSLAAHGNTIGLAAKLDNQQLLSDQGERRALLGLIEAERAEARATRLLGHVPESAALAASASDLAAARGVNEPQITARLYRTAAFIDTAEGRRADALSGFSASAEAFARALPGSRTYAETALLWAGQLAQDGRAAEALATCRSAAAALREGNYGTDAEWLQPCLKLLDSTARAQTYAAQAQATWAEMFEFGQLARGSITSQQIAQASARLSENARDPRVAALIRARDDEQASLAALYQVRDDAHAANDANAQPVDDKAAKAADADLARQIAALHAKQADTEAALQAASPNYAQLVQQVVSARDIFHALHPGEAFAAIVLSRDAGWTFVLRDQQIAVSPITGGTATVAALVHRVRASLDAETEPPPPFDIAAATSLYDMLLRGVAPALKDATALSVAPTGPLLSLPFGVLLAGPATQDDLAHAPWLIQHLRIEHVPAPANFVSLRKLAGNSRASRPWFGFGDFHPVTLAQAKRSFPAATCADSARLLASLPPLPGATIELDAVRGLTGATSADELLGNAFTVAAVTKAHLKDVRVLHFATHALLPTDLRCQNEPALVTSPPPGAEDASGALLTASDVAGLDLDADAVVLSACNTGGPGGATAGESLTGLARSFFYAGARALLVTHWSVNDRTTAYLVALTLAGAEAHPEQGLAGALAAAQRRMLADARGDVAVQAHPFYWGALAVIGEGMGVGRAGA